jgi:hypothetical protein
VDAKEIVMKRMHCVVVVFLLFVFCCPSVLALDTMGPPVAGLSKGQFLVGASYSDTELSIDFDFDDGTGPMPDFTKDNLRIDTIGGVLGYGLNDTWDVYVGVGSADAVSSQDGERHTADGMAYGLATKLTLYQDGELEVGGLVRARWAELDGEASAGAAWSGDLELDIMQLQLAVGPTYQLVDWACIYGGPFWYYLDGEKRYDEPGWFEEYEMSNTSDFGGYVGVLLELYQSSCLTIEYQLTGDDDALALSLAWKL